MAMKLKDYLQRTKTFDQKPRRGPDSRLVQTHFNAVARHYDLVNTIMSLGSQRIWKRRAIKVFDPKPGQILADICGGTADLALLVQGRRGAEAGEILVYDLNRAMLDGGRRKARSSPLGRGLSFIRGDALELALGSDSLDGIIVGFGVRNLADLSLGLREMVRALRPGGRLVCLEFSRPQARWFSTLYGLYSGLMMPLMGRIFTGSWRTYEHLAGSIRDFPAPEELGGIMREAGLAGVRWQSLTAGIAAIHLGVKP